MAISWSLEITNTNLLSRRAELEQDGKSALEAWEATR
jgi:hypothetical protein